MASSNHGAIASTSPPFPRPINHLQVKQNFLYYRNKFGLKQADVAAKLNQSQSTISRWLSLKSPDVPPIGKVLSIAAVLHVEPVTLTIEHEAIEKLARGDDDIKIDPITGDVAILRPHPRAISEYKNNIRFFRLSQNLSQKELAARIEVTQGSVSMWERLDNDRLPTGAKVCELAAALGTSTDMLSGPVATVSTQGFNAPPFPKPENLAQLKANFNYYRQRSNLSKSALAVKLDLKPITIGRWENPSSVSFIPVSKVNDVARVLDAEPSALTLEDLITTSPSENQSAPASVVANDADRIYDEKANVAQIYLLNENDPLLNMTTSTFAAAGPEVPSDMQDETSISEMIGMQLGNGLAAARVTGDSMYIPETGAGIPDGAIVIIDTSQRDIQSAMGKVVCYRVNGCYLVKRLRNNHGKLNAVSDNPNYFPLFYSDADEVELIGQVVGMLQSIK